MNDPRAEAIAALLGFARKAAPPEPAKAPDVRSFACQVVREYARLVTPASPMRWEHTLRKRATGKEYRVTVTLEEI